MSPLPFLLQSLEGVTAVRGKEEWNKKAVLTAYFSCPVSRLLFWAEWANPPLLQLRSSLQQQGRGWLEAQQPAAAFWEESALSHHTITLHDYHHLARTMTNTFHKWLINGYYFYFSLFPFFSLGPISHASTSQASWKAIFKVSSPRLSVIHIKVN